MDRFYKIIHLWSSVDMVDFELQKGRGIKVSHLLICFSVGCKTTEDKANARSFMQVSQVNGRDTNTWIIFCCFFQAKSRELGGKWNSWEMNWH